MVSSDSSDEEQTWSYFIQRLQGRLTRSPDRSERRVQEKKQVAKEKHEFIASYLHTLFDDEWMEKKREVPDSLSRVLSDSKTTIETKFGIYHLLKSCEKDELCRCDVYRDQIFKQSQSNSFAEDTCYKILDSECATSPRLLGGKGNRIDRETNLYRETSAIHSSKHLSVYSILRHQMTGSIGTIFRNTVTSTFWPRDIHHEYNFQRRVFCGKFSPSGSLFACAGQMENISIFDYSNKLRMKTFKVPRDVGWSVLDVDFDRYEERLLYTSWSKYVHLVATSNEDNTHEALDVSSGALGSFCVFSARLNQSSSLILCGCVAGRTIVYDATSKVARDQCNITAGDVNAVEWGSEFTNICYAGGDSGIVVVYDLRSFSEGPVAMTAAHNDGIVSIASRGDDRYFATSSKDQTIKLWDLRHMPTTGLENDRGNVWLWDYRQGRIPSKYNRYKILPKQEDGSIMTYYGHTINRTLIRCGFTPRHSTGGRYIFTGSADSRVWFYDILNDSAFCVPIISDVDRRDAVLIRDVSWHPYDHIYCTSAWNGFVSLFSNGKPPRGRTYTKVSPQLPSFGQMEVEDSDDMEEEDD